MTAFAPEIRVLGGTGLELTTVGAGIPSSGSEASVAQTLMRSLASGLNWVAMPDGSHPRMEERFVGRFLSSLSIETPFYLVARCARLEDMSSADQKPVAILTPELVRLSCERTLDRLGVDHLDLLLLPRPDYLAAPIEESWGELCTLAQEGKVRFVGLSDFPDDLAWRCELERHVDAMEIGSGSAGTTRSRDLVPPGTGVICRIDRPSDADSFLPPHQAVHGCRDRCTVAQRPRGASALAQVVARILCTDGITGVVSPGDDPTGLRDTLVGAGMASGIQDSRFVRGPAVSARSESYLAAL